MKFCFSGIWYASYAYFWLMFFVFIRNSSSRWVGKALPRSWKRQKKLNVWTSLQAIPLRQHSRTWNSRKLLISTPKLFWPSAHYLLLENMFEKFVGCESAWKDACICTCMFLRDVTSLNAGKSPLGCHVSPEHQLWWALLGERGKQENGETHSISMQRNSVWPSPGEYWDVYKRHRETCVRTIWSC